MEAVFLEHTYRWLAMEGVLILVIPFERLHDCAGILASHFTQLAVLRMTDEESVKYRQIAVLGLRRDVRGAVVENNKRQLLSVGLYASFLGLPELQTGACPPYSVPPSRETELSYRGLPYDLLEDLLPQSGAWKQAAPLLMPHEDVATGRPITPLHGGHVGLLCTAGLLNGVFGQGDDRHIARWRSVKHVTTFVEQDGDTEISGDDRAAATAFCIVRIKCALVCESLRPSSMPAPSWTVQALELRPSPVYRKLGAGREGRIEREEEDGLGDLVRRPEALHRAHTDHLLPKLGGHVFIGKCFADDRRVDGTGRHRVDANLARKQLNGERPSE